MYCTCGKRIDRNHVSQFQEAAIQIISLHLKCIDIVLTYYYIPGVSISTSENDVLLFMGGTLACLIRSTRCWILFLRQW